MLGHVAPFDLVGYTAAMKGHGTYVAGICFAWLKQTHITCPGVPIGMERVRRLQRHWFANGPRFFPDKIVVCMVDGEATESMLGQLLPISPEELRAAYVLQIAEDIENGTDNWQLWEQSLLSVPAEFRVFPDAEMRYLFAVQLRENAQILAENIRRTALGRIYEIFAFKCTKEQSVGRVTNDMIADAYVKVRVSETAEQVTKTFVETALMLHNLLKANPCVKAVLIAMDSSAYNPINSLTKIRGLCVAVDKDPRKMKWTFESILDQWTYGRFEDGETISTRDIAGRALMLGKGVADIYMYQLIWGGEGSAEIICDPFPLNQSHTPGSQPPWFGAVLLGAFPEIAIICNRTTHEFCDHKVPTQLAAVARADEDGRLRVGPGGQAETRRVHHRPRNLPRSVWVQPTDQPQPRHIDRMAGYAAQKRRPILEPDRGGYLQLERHQHGEDPRRCCGELRCARTIMINRVIMRTHDDIADNRPHAGDTRATRGARGIARSMLQNA